MVGGALKNDLWLNESTTFLLQKVRQPMNHKSSVSTRCTPQFLGICTYEFKGEQNALIC
jgi:hypothetical protein